MVNGIGAERRYNLVFSFNAVVVEPYQVAVGPYIQDVADIRRLQELGCKSIVDL
jgi:hypothetical protein